MTTSPTTCEERLRETLLDVLHAQWRAFGLPLQPSRAATLGSAPLEVIDPEALVWCTLEWVPSQPRLREGLHAWLRANRGRLNRQRLNKFAASAKDDPRVGLWDRLDRQGPPDPGRDAKASGEAVSGAATLLLRSRDVLGNDCRSFLIVQLIGSPRGVRLRDVAQSTSYAYRSVSEAATGWERAGIVRIRHGHCLLLLPAPWCEILRCRPADVVTVDWTAAYAVALSLLGFLTNARTSGFDDTHPLVAAAIRDADTKLEATAPGVARGSAPGVESLREALQVQ